MHSFTDAKGRPWQLEINVDAIEEVQADCGVNILDVADPNSNLLKELITFPPLLAKLLFACLADQARLKEVDDREFRRSMNGDALQAGHDALLDEIILFSPKHRRSLLQTVRERNQELEEAGTNLALARLTDPDLKKEALAAMDREVTARIAEALQRISPRRSPTESESWTAAGQPPGSSASPRPAPIPGDG